MIEAHQPGQIKTPRYPRTGAEIIPWARDVVAAIQQLRDRKVYYSRSGGGGGSTFKHPWKVTANGDDTVNIGYGSLLAFEDNWMTLREFKYFSGTVAEEISAVKVTGTGSIYGKVAAAVSSGLLIDTTLNVIGGEGTVDVDYLRTFPDEGEFADITFLFSDTVPGNVSNDWYFELAKVELNDSIASVTRQILTHNPTLSGFVEPS